MLNQTIQTAAGQVQLRFARPADARAIWNLAKPYVQQKILVDKPLIAYFEDIQEFIVAERDGEVLACGALHVLWDDIAEVRTLAASPAARGSGVGSLILNALVERARDLQLKRVFCLTFAVDFFARHGFEAFEGMAVGVDVYQKMLRTHDDGVREFLELASVKPNTLGNTRMILRL